MEVVERKSSNLYSNSLSSMNSHKSTTTTRNNETRIKKPITNQQQQHQQAASLCIQSIFSLYSAMLIES